MSRRADVKTLFWPGSGSNRAFTRLKVTLLCCNLQPMAIRAARSHFGVHHEYSHRSLDSVYGCCRLYVGKKHAINDQHYHAWFDYWSSDRCRARDHVHSQSQTQTHLVRNLRTQRTAPLPPKALHVRASAPPREQGWTTRPSGVGVLLPSLLRISGMINAPRSPLQSQLLGHTKLSTMDLFAIVSAALA